MKCGWRLSSSILRRSRLTWLSIERSKTPGLRPDVSARELLKMPGQDLLVQGLLVAGLLEEREDVISGKPSFAVGQQRLDGDLKLAAREW